MKGTFFFIFLVIGVCIRAQEKETDNFPPPETPVTISAFKTKGVITVDGRLDESDWDATERVTNFFGYWGGNPLRIPFGIV